MSWNGVRDVYGVFAALAALELALIATVEPLRSAVGRTEGLGLAIRCLPSLAVLGVCGWAYVQLRSDARSGERFVLVLSVVFVALGFLTLTPWVGMFAALLTPISVLYFAAILWVPQGFFVAVGVAVAFMILNVTTGRLAYRRIRESRSAR